LAIFSQTHLVTLDSLHILRKNGRIGFLRRPEKKLSISSEKKSEADEGFGRQTEVKYPFMTGTPSLGCTT
jgi:hypothetical protein